MVKTIVIEGQDQVGKADSTAAIVDMLSRAGNLVRTISYPYYALPFGTLVRAFLTENEKFRKISGLEHVWDTPRQLEITGVILALNRLETLPGIIETVDDDSILVCDRGPYSMCVTVAYGLNYGLIEENDVSGMLDKFLDIDSAYRSYLGTDNAIIQLKSEGDIKQVRSGERTDTDIYEVSTVQSLTRQVYEQMSKRFVNWAEVVTRYDGVGMRWRDRKEILEENGSFLRKWGFKVDIGSINDNDTNNQYDKNIEMNTDLNVVKKRFVDIEDTARALYGIHLDRSDVILWRDAHARRNEDLIHSSSKHIGQKISRLVKPGDISWPTEVVDHISRLIKEYPEVLVMAENILCNEFSSALKISAP
ncbi:hypothetical protein H6763_03725 [Candidatus Nomurabacteria bacterium]|uniref:Thymidylate kinase-like domain-containing protein n=1 Tax=Candidatus Dojkabacteria bacterium TaxID=2099670 RepID=A0A955I3E7_9BACT|nr:hypothetical protein [Candidatus Dojkabacteria bacterium]MCB9789594.1 hypothetical protein [Candidatus Nomurabacteria bacterium]MCB9803914.1 hypothetical protein [Candidatus Nomurabacteria bacterium]